MFTQACFIRKNTKELVEKLEELGYSPGFSARNNYGNALQTGYHKSIGRIYGYEDIIDDNSDDAIFGVNCGTNEELFLSIAALRDDSDKHQWFVDDFDNSIWQKSEWNNANLTKCHKATVAELIEHFNK